MQQLLHICSEHYEAKEKEKEEDKDKKDKKDKDKKDSAADMGSHQVTYYHDSPTFLSIISAYNLFYMCLWICLLENISKLILLHVRV